MTRKPLEVLKKGLSKITQTFKARKDELNAKLARKETISSLDAHWLDNGGNTIDEERIIETLEAAPNYERGVEALDGHGKAIVRRLREWAGDIPKIPGNKRKPAAGSEREKAAKAAQDKAKPPMIPVLTKKENSTLEQRIAILDWHHKNGENQSATARHFQPIYPNLQIKQPLISRWVKQEAQIREQWELASDQNDRTAKRARRTEHPEITEMMHLWVSKAMSNNILLTGEILSQKWNAFADLLGVPEGERRKSRDGWLARFREKNGWKEKERYGEAASITVEWERHRIQELIMTHNYRLRDIFNMVETGLSYGMAPDRGLSDHTHPGVRGKKTILTYALTSNADGSEKLAPFVIGKAKQPRAFNKKSGKELGFYYGNNAKAWMTANLYQGWIEEWDKELQKQNRKILLLQDNFSGHVVPPNLQNIRVETFEPNFTAHVQPEAQGIIRCFKAYYRTRFIQRAVNRYDEGVSPAQIYGINQLQAMRLADAAWNDVDNITIQNCWRKAGILPYMDFSPPTQPPSVPFSFLPHDSLVQTDPVAHAERQVEEALDELVATGTLQPWNRTDIESLLSSAAESQMLTETSDQEIYEAVVLAFAARENSEINGHDDVDDDPSVPVEPRPTRREVLKAASIIERYTSDLNDPMAREIEALLGSLTRQLRLEETRSTRNGDITDYFKRS